MQGAIRWVTLCVLWQSIDHICIDVLFNKNENISLDSGFETANFKIAVFISTENTP